MVLSVIVSDHKLAPRKFVMILSMKLYEYHIKWCWVLIW